jgi:hypothetical protein
MFSASAEYYDLVYAAIRDYPRDVTAVGALLRGRNAACVSVLDVACGTGRGVRVTRTSRIDIDGRISRLRFDYDVSEAGGTRRFQEVHELGLFTTDELLEAFAHAGLSAAYDAAGLVGRGLFVATPVVSEMPHGAKPRMSPHT